MKPLIFLSTSLLLLLASCSEDPQQQQAEAMRQACLHGQSKQEEMGGELNNLSSEQKTKLVDKVKENFPGVNLEEAKKKYHEMKDDPKVKEMAEKMLKEADAS
jgi:hypothetical protein